MAPTIEYVGIDHCGFNGAVTEQLLDGSDVINVGSKPSTVRTHAPYADCNDAAQREARHGPRSYPDSTFPPYLGLLLPLYLASTQTHR